MERAPTLRAGGHRNSHANAGVVPAIAFAQNNRGEVRFKSGHGQVTCTMLSSGKPGYGVPMVACLSLPCLGVSTVWWLNRAAGTRGMHWRPTTKRISATTGMTPPRGTGRSGACGS